MAFINNNDVRIRYEIEGNGIPMVLHHGFGNCIEDYYELGYVDALKDKYKLILIDCRGFGKSDKPHDVESYRFDLRASDTVAIMDALGIEKAIAWGNSMGGRTVYALMQYHSDRFIAYCAGGMHPYAENGEMTANLCKWLSQGMLHAVNSFEQTYKPFPKNLRERYLKNDPLAMIAVASTKTLDFTETLSKINVPILMYCGAKEDYRSDMERSAQLIRCGELKILDGLDHCQTYWSGKIVCNYIKEFLLYNGIS